jgi:hypothetical protein
MVRPAHTNPTPIALGPWLNRLAGHPPPMAGAGGTCKLPLHTLGKHSPAHMR